MKANPKPPVNLPAVASYPLAICSSADADGKLVASDRVQILPAGQFRGLNGLPDDAPHWYIDAAIAARLIADVAARSTDLCIDYDHQTLFAAKTGVKAVASAWFKALEWVEGVGLFATGVEWTAAARAHIEAGEFRYISPVFAYDKKTGAVLSIINAALTNTPNLDGMADVADLVAASLAAASLQPTPEASMNEELLEQLRWLLNMPVGATAEDIKAQLQKLMDQLKSAGTAAATFSLFDHLAGLEAKIAAASQTTPDLSKFVPIGDLQAVQKELGDLRVAVNSEKVDALVKGALAEGRLLPAQEKWARELGNQNLAALSQFIETMQPNPALAGGMQSGGTGVAINSQQSDVDTQVMKALGLSTEQFAAGKLEA